ncbi:MAG: ATP-dependent endonuclease [Flavobacteriales bacterium]
MRFDTRFNTKNNIDLINTLLLNIELKEDNDLGFEIFNKNSGEKVNTDSISSGESELISLAIECLTFAKQSKEEKRNLLLMDEPDVHLHPDLQVRFVQFLQKICEENPLNVIIATHSTAILGGLVDYEYARFAIQENGNYNLKFKPITESYKKVLPVFGTHPLSNLFNENPIFLVEGGDDERIFQQAVRTSEGHLSIHPCVAGSKDELRDYEEAAKELLNGVYDEPRAYSLRDRDEEDEHIEDDPPITCFKTSCRNAENLILTDEVLEKLNTNWEELRTKLDRWLEVRTDHEKHGQVQAFQADGYDRKNAQLKEIRNILIGETPSDKPWEVAVGQAIGELAKGDIEKDFGEGKLCNFLGRKLVDEVIAPDPQPVAREAEES